MKYQYNYSFLSKWLEINKDIPKYAIQTALGSKSNNGFKSWLRGDGAMPVITMLRFCNAFQIPLTSFFCDLDAEEGACIQRPDSDTQLEPNGGYAVYKDRTQGERSALDPIDVNIMPSIIPGAKKERDTSVNVNEDGDKEVVVGNISDANMLALIELQEKHAAAEAEGYAQRNKLLDIIADQQKQIADLTNTIMNLRNAANAHNSFRYDMVAEEPPSRH